MKIFQQWWETFLGAITFYTIIYISSSWKIKFQGIATYASWVGVILGSILALIDIILEFLGFPILTRSAVIVGFWIYLTGGLHLDGVMDTADGLAIFNNPQKRLDVMKDSLTGAFGVMAGCFIILLKIIALSDLSDNRSLILMATLGWGRWGQIVAIACYPYLRKEGKGAFHQEKIKPILDICISFCFYLIFSGIVIFFNPIKAELLLQMLGYGVGISLITGFWFYKKLGGHTGDTYGAVVEWTEALFLFLLTRIDN